VTGLSGAKLTQALQAGCQQGQLAYDLAKGEYRYRPLVAEALELDRLEYRNDRERVAYDLLARKGAVSIATENRVHGTGIELIGKVLVSEDKREYRPSFLLGEEGEILRAECSCATFRKQGLKGGPCAHLIALRLAYGREQEERSRGAAKGRKTVTVETRTYSKRRPSGEEIVQVSLDRARLSFRWGARGTDLRVQKLVFNSVGDARAAYFARVDELEEKGYLDASAG
jgi:predicted nucleic acid-binding Zn finger protein